MGSPAHCSGLSALSPSEMQMIFSFSGVVGPNARSNFWSPSPKVNSFGFLEVRLSGGHNFRMSERKVAVAAAAQSALDLEIEEDDNFTFTSIAAGDPNGSPVGRRRIVQISNGGRPVTDPWFAGPRKENSAHLTDKVFNKKLSNYELGLEVDGDVNSSESPSPKFRSPRADPKVKSQNPEKGRRQSQGLVTKTKIAPPKQQRTDPGLVIQPGGTLDNVLQLLERTTSGKGVTKVMEQFTSELTIQDLRQLLTELGTGPERNWAKALQVFDWMHDMAVYDIDASMYHSMLVLLGKCKKMEIAESMVERMKMDGLIPDSYICTALVSGYVRSGNIQKGISVIDKMKADGIRPPVSAYNILIDGCLKVPRGFDVARSLLKQMKQDGISPDRITYTTMIIVNSRKGHHQEAIRMFQEMLMQQCHPDVLAYNAVLNAFCKLGDVQGMLQVHRSMSEHQVDPDTVTFNILLNALGRAGRTKDVCRFYRLMRKIRVTPDVTTCSILVNAYGKVRAWEELDALIAEMESLGLQPDLTVYNSLISIYGKAGRFEQVELIIKSLQTSSGIKFDVITYNSLIDVYGKGGRLSDVIKWFSEMRKQEVKPDVRTFNALVHAYGRASQYEGVKEVLELFQADGSKPDLVFYHTLLFMFAKGAKYEEAWGVIEDMKQEGYTLALDIYNSLVLVFGRSNAQEAVKMYADMIASNVKPNAQTFKVLIEVHARKGLVDECLKIFRKSREFLGNDLNDSVLSSVFGACCNMRRIEEAERILQELKDQEVLPSVACLNWLILGYGRQGLPTKAEEVVERIKSMGLVPNAQSYNFLLEAYSLCGCYDKAEALRLKMHDEGLVCSVSAYNTLIRYYVRSRKVHLALETLGELQKLGLKPSHNTYGALISGYGSGDDLAKEKMLGHVRDLERLQLDPKHGIYTALLSAIPKCKSHKEAQQFMVVLQKLDCPSEICSTLKDVMCEDNQEEVLWISLAGKLRSIDMNGFNLETQRSLQNSIIDALWWLGWEVRALRVVRISMELGTFGQVFNWTKSDWTLNLSGASTGAVQILLLMWITSMRKLTTGGEEVPPQVRIILGEEWQLLLDENKASIEAVKAHLVDLGVAFSPTEDRTALDLSGSELSSLLRQDHLDKKLFLLNSLLRN